MNPSIYYLPLLTSSSFPLLVTHLPLSFHSLVIPPLVTDFSLTYAGEQASEITFMVHGHASICKILNTVYERKTGALRRIKTVDEKETDALFAVPMGYV